MRFLQWFLPYAALSLAITVPARAEQTRVTLLHTTDLHGALTAWDYAHDEPVSRGLVRLATLVAGARAEGVPTLLVDAGDATEGGIESSWHQGPQRHPDPMIAAMNALHYDAMTVGNHEFDLGWSSLARTRRAARFPWLGANVVNEHGGRPLFVPSIVKRVGPLRIGIVGICTPAVPRFVDSAFVAGVRFDDPVASARAEVARLRKDERCDAVVLVAHTGLERDPVTGAERRGDTPDENWGYRLAAEVPGIDVLVLGHTHTVVASAEVNGVLISQAGRWGENLGRIDLVFERAGEQSPWRLAGRRAQVTAVADSVADDPTLAALAAPYHGEARTLLARTVGRIDRDLEAPWGRFASGSAWELIHRAQIAATGADVSLAALPDPAARVPRGAVTRRDLLRLYPYGNTIGLVEMTGDDLRAALEQSARWFKPYTFSGEAPSADPAYPAYNFDTAYGVTYGIDLTRPAGDRIVNLAFHGVPVAPGQRFKVAVNSYRMNGGGGFESIRHARRLRTAPVTVRDAIAKLIATGGDTATVTAGWTLVPDYTRTLERPLVDRMVRLGAVAAEDVKHLDPHVPATARDLDRWIAASFGDGSTVRGAQVGAESWSASAASNGADGALTRGMVADALVRAATRAGYAGFGGAHGDPRAVASFRTALVTGTSLMAAGDGAVPNRAQTLGMVANARFPIVRVLETTDFHGAILPGPPDRRTGRVIGGSAALASAIERLSAENPEGTVLIDGGDLFQGTMISNLQFGRPVVEQMNVLRYAGSVIGNHEFDWGVDTLEQRVHEMHFAALGANMRERSTGKMPSWVRSDTSFTRRGVRVSVMGLCYRFTPTVTLAKNVARLDFLDDSTTAAALAPRLRAGCDVLVGIGHIPASSDSAHHMRGGDLPRLAGVKGVDAWFGGHSHNLVLDTVDGIPFAIAGSHGGTIAVCDLTVDPAKHQVVERHCDLRTVYDDEGVDSVMAARVVRWNASVGPIAGVAIGVNEHRLTRNRGGEGTLGDFVTDAMRDASGADIAMQNSGGLRADLEAGTVTRGTIYEVMPFDNTVFTMQLTGAEVKLALEQALRSQRVTQVSGIRYTFDLGAPEMHRVVSVTLPDGKPLDDGHLYTVAVNDFMATGGDDYAVLSGGKQRTQTDLRVRDVLEQMVIKLAHEGKSLDYESPGRIARFGGSPETRDSK